MRRPFLLFKFQSSSGNMIVRQGRRPLMSFPARRVADVTSMHSKNTVEVQAIGTRDPASFIDHVVELTLPEIHKHADGARASIACRRE